MELAPYLSSFPWIEHVKGLSKTAFLLALLACPGTQPAFAQPAPDTAYDQWVDYRDGEISVEFDHIPVDLALAAIRAKTGLLILLPSVPKPPSLNLRIFRLPFEPAVRSLISAIGFKSFALVYDQKGHPKRAFVLGAASDDRKNPTPGAGGASPNPETAAQQLTAEEQGKIRNELERWSELSPEERSRIEERLKILAPSDAREQLVQEYGRQLLGIKN